MRTKRSIHELQMKSVLSRRTQISFLVCCLHLIASFFVSESSHPHIIVLLHLLFSPSLERTRSKNVIIWTIERFSIIRARITTVCNYRSLYVRELKKSLPICSSNENAMHPIKLPSTRRMLCMSVATLLRRYEKHRKI